MVTACQTGDTALIEASLQRHSDKLPLSDQSISRLALVLVAGDDANALRWLLDRFPEFPQNDTNLWAVHSLIYIRGGQTEVVKTFMNRFPQAIPWMYDHQSGSLGMAIRANDLELVAFLIHLNQEKGAGAEKVCCAMEGYVFGS